MDEEIEYKGIIILDLTNCMSGYDFHERIRIAFDWPEWYGKNWDAFIDLLRSDCPAEKIIVIGLNTISKKLVDFDYAEKTKKILNMEKSRRAKHGEKLEIIYSDAEDIDIDQYKF